MDVSPIFIMKWENWFLFFTQQFSRIFTGDFGDFSDTGGPLVNQVSLHYAFQTPSHLVLVLQLGRTRWSSRLLVAGGW